MEQYSEDFKENAKEGNDEDDNDDDKENNDNDDNSDDEDIMDAVVDREARRVLFDLLHITYHFIRVYKAAQFDEVVDFVADKFEVNYIYLCLIFEDEI